MTLGWTDFEVVAAGVATGSVPAVLTYFLNERSSRKQLEREQEYVRRRGQYEKALGALSRKRDLVVSFQLFLRFHSIYGKRAESPSPANTAGGAAPSQDDLGVLFSRSIALIADVLNETPSPSLSPEDFLKGGPEERTRVAGTVIDGSLRGIGRASTDFDFAMIALTLADASEEFVFRARRLSEKLSLPSDEDPRVLLNRNYDYERITQEIWDLTLIALEDLKDVLGSRVDIELIRQRPLRSVETKPTSIKTRGQGGDSGTTTGSSRKTE